jgi:hypothetical protein
MQYLFPLSISVYTIITSFHVLSFTLHVTVGLFRHPPQPLNSWVITWLSSWGGGVSQQRSVIERSSWRSATWTAQPHTVQPLTLLASLSFVTIYLLTQHIFRTRWQRHTVHSDSTLAFLKTIHSGLGLLDGNSEASRVNRVSVNSK